MKLLPESAHCNSAPISSHGFKSSHAGGTTSKPAGKSWPAVTNGRRLKNQRKSAPAGFLLIIKGTKPPAAKGAATPKDIFRTSKQSFETSIGRIGSDMVVLWVKEQVLQSYRNGLA